METDSNLKFLSIPDIDKQIFKKIWNEPRSVFQFLYENEYNKQVDRLLILSSITFALGNAVGKGIGDEESLAMIILICSLEGLFIGWPVYYIYADLLNRTGKWLNAQGNYKSLIRMLAYASIPSILCLGIIITLMMLFGSSLFKSEFDPFLEKGDIMGIIYCLLSLMSSLLALGTLLLIVIGVSVVQGLSIIQSIINCLLALAIFSAPFLVLKMLFNFLI